MAYLPMVGPGGGTKRIIVPEIRSNRYSIIQNDTYMDENGLVDVHLILKLLISSNITAATFGNWTGGWDSLNMPTPKGYAPIIMPALCLIHKSYENRSIGYCLANFAVYPPANPTESSKSTGYVLYYKDITLPDPSTEYRLSINGSYMSTGKWS